MSGVLAFTIASTGFLYGAEKEVFCLGTDGNNVMLSDDYSDSVKAPNRKKPSCAVKDANAAIINIDTDVASVDADTFVIMTATEEMNKMVLELFKTILGADRSDQQAIFDKISGLSSEQISTALKSTSAKTTGLKKISDLKRSAVEDVNSILTAISQSGKNGSIVISNVYNPFGNIEGGTVSLASTTIQLYVDEINEELSQLAKSQGAVIADVSQTDTSIQSVSGLGGTEAAQTLKTIFSQQHETITETVNNTAVSSSSVEYTYGDINNDGQIDSADLTIMLKYQLSYDRDLKRSDDEDLTNKGYNFKAGDVCKDGVVCDVYDLTYLKRCIIGDIDRSVLGKVIF